MGFMKRGSERLTAMDPGRNGKSEYETFQEKVARVAQLTKALSCAVEELVFVELPLAGNFHNEVRHFEKSLIERALKRSAGSQVKAAEILKLKKTTLHSKIRKY